MLGFYICLFIFLSILNFVLSLFQEAVLNGLVATEVWMWFYVGEIIGKRGIVGYDV